MLSQRGQGESSCSCELQLHEGHTVAEGHTEKFEKNAYLDMVGWGWERTPANFTDLVATLCMAARNKKSGSTTELVLLSLEQQLLSPHAATTEARGPTACAL